MLFLMPFLVLRPDQHFDAPNFDAPMGASKGASKGASNHHATTLIFDAPKKKSVKEKLSKIYI